MKKDVTEKDGFYPSLYVMYSKNAIATVSRIFLSIRYTYTHSHLQIDQAFLANEYDPLRLHMF